MKLEIGRLPGPHIQTGLDEVYPAEWARTFENRKEAVIRHIESSPLCGRHHEELLDTDIISNSSLLRL